MVNIESFAKLSSRYLRLPARILHYAQNLILGISIICLWQIFSQALILKKNLTLIIESIFIRDGEKLENLHNYQYTSTR